MVGRSTRNYLVNSKFRVELLDGAKFARKFGWRNGKKRSLLMLKESDIDRMVHR